MKSSSWRSILGAALLISFAIAGCAVPAVDGEDEDDPDETPAAPPSVTLRLDGREVALSGGSCVWYEDSSQLFVEVGDADGANYLILAAPLEWLGEELPEGPGAEPELSIRLAGEELPIDQQSVSGDMTPEQTVGAFAGRLDDGRMLSGEWHCPEVLDD